MCNKLCYDTYGDAADALKHVRKARGNGRSERRVTYCRICVAYHLTGMAKDEYRPEIALDWERNKHYKGR